MADELIRLPYNPQGNLPAARVSEELITVRPSTGDGFNFSVPVYAPYFRNGFKLYNPETNAYLVEGVDYLHTHAFNAMASLVGLEIYGSIMLIDRAFTGNLQVSYYSLGGEFTLDAQQMLELLANNLLNPRTTYWENVTDTPAVFPPINHQHDVATDTMTWDDVVIAIESLREPLEQGLNMAMQALKEHERRQDNPHIVTKDQVGLGNVLNYTVATEADLDSGGENLYMTLATTRKMIASLSGDSAAAHIANRNNPHVVTKDQVGLGSVDNFATATNSDMISGLATNMFATPAGVMAAIQANAIDGLANHLADRNNPHGTTKGQVGLDLVPNYQMASNSEADAGDALNRFMSPGLARRTIQSLAAMKQHTHVPSEVGCLALGGGTLTGEVTFVDLHSADGKIAILASNGSSVFTSMTAENVIASKTFRSDGQLRVTTGGVRVDSGNIEVKSGGITVTAGDVVVRATNGNESKLDSDGDLTAVLWANSIETGSSVGKLSNYLQDFKAEILAIAGGGVDLDARIDARILQAMQASTDGTISITQTQGSQFNMGIAQPFVGTFIANDFEAMDIDPEVDATQSTLSSDSDSLPAGGADTAKITLRLNNKYGLQIGGQQVQFQTTNGTFDAVTEDIVGVYSAKLTAGPTAGSAVVTPTVNGIAYPTLTATIQII